MKKLISLESMRPRQALAYLKRMFSSGITRRWLKNVFGTVLLATIAVVILFCMFAQSSYYNMLSARLRADAQNVGHYYTNFITTDSFETAAHAMVEDFEDKNLMEIQIFDIEGNVAVSSSGFPMGEVYDTPDLISAKAGKAGHWRGKLPPTQEKVMSYSLPLKDEYGNIQGTVRLLTTLVLADDMLAGLYFFIALLGFGIILLTGLSGVYFIKSIVVPVALITDAANAIAKGNMTQRIEIDNNEDELDNLCATINTMAQELGESEKVKNDFISSVSHELRTPLTAIRGWSETMIATQSEDMDPTTRRGIEVIYKETERLSKLVEELLDSSRIQNGRFKLMVAPTDIVAEFEDTVFMMMERARLENVTIEYEPGPDSVEILGDKNRLKQVFFNIIDNAIKHSEDDGKIQTAVTLNENSVCITIADHGEGISEQDLPFVKQMFYKGHSQKRGSGIGLGVADEIIKRHSGTLDIASVEGQGTTVTITLPLGEEALN